MIVGKYKLKREDTVLVVIDLQERLMNAMKDREKVYKNTNLLLSTAKEFNIPVILSEQYPRGLGPTVAVIKENLPADYIYLEKLSFSLCGAGLFEMLAEIGKNTIIVCGSETHVCVFQTVRDLVEAGYNVHLVRDAVCSRFDENYENSLNLMSELGAVVSNTETVVFDLLEVAGTKEFKAISPLIK
ncbi:MAG TPA: hydrolase [Gelria sp.]|jgi:nicotinamidase-related amidase|nr:hydrolase [Gelria sp.]